MSEQQVDYKTRKQTIFRTIKDKDNPFVMIDRRPIENPNLSWKAKGVLSYLLSRPDNWIVRLQDLVRRSSDKSYAIRGAIRELQAAGHVHRKEVRGENGQFLRYELEVYELPFTVDPLIGFPQADNPQADNLPLNDTDLTDTDLKSGVPPLSEKELEQVNRKVDAILANQGGWEGREVFQPEHYPLVDWYHQMTGQVCPKSKRKDWMKAAGEWRNNGLSVADLQAAYDMDIKWRGVFTSPNQLTEKAIALKAQKQASPETPGPKRHKL